MFFCFGMLRKLLRRGVVEKSGHDMVKISNLAWRCSDSGDINQPTFGIQEVWTAWKDPAMIGYPLYRSCCFHRLVTPRLLAISISRFFFSTPHFLFMVKSAILLPLESTFCIILLPNARHWAFQSMKGSGRWVKACGLEQVDEIWWVSWGFSKSSATSPGFFLW